MSLRCAVVIPAYRAAGTVGAAVRSALEQTMPPLEVVVVDDGSDDDTARVAEDAGARVLRQSNAGPGAARNHGVRKADPDAEWIAFLDADDRFWPEKLAVQVEAVLGDDSLDGVGSDAVVEGVETAQVSKNAGKAIDRRPRFAALVGSNPLICSTMLVRREAFDAVGGFDEARELIATEDWDLWLRLLRRRDQSILYLDRPLAGYDGRGDSLGSDERFLVGVERILDKQEQLGLSSADRQTARGRRAGVRLDLAWRLARASDRQDRRRARKLIAEALRLGAPMFPAAKTWLRSVVPG